MKTVHHKDGDPTNNHVGNLAIKEASGERDAFKDFVHRRLDAAGVPKEFPDGPHTKEGCRIGDRLDWVLERWSERAATPIPSVTVVLPAPVSPKSGCSPGALRAAQAVLSGSEHGAIRWHGPDGRNQWCWQYRHQDEVAEIIDRETGLPELLRTCKEVALWADQTAWEGKNAIVVSLESAIAKAEEKS